ncbi:uncharacterized membrane protein (DUF485 family) [Bacillus benzoevorans]|uniref:Uncharacterized membrane protein (DUF485 family) n=1 Tax=Bacillus benzoevorans TaxID=1456 RepID=A0A7X0HRX2_9BACI|nr:DUF485 domain-containing protein [Bacillus benzoevorans]MBB6445770.1 uncharacterized membrane protein (DUF485 family) [Bacillus benzoevorans]
MENYAKTDVVQQKEPNYDFEKIAGSQDFKHLLNTKKKFLIPSTIIFLSLYFLLPILTSYTTILNEPAIGSISWTWIYSMGLFVMTWVLCMTYVKKAAKFDSMAEEIVENQGEQKL